MTKRLTILTVAALILGLSFVYAGPELWVTKKFELTGNGAGVFTVTSKEAQTYIGNVRWHYDTAVAATVTVEIVSSSINGVVDKTNIVFTGTLISGTNSLMWLPEWPVYLEASEVVRQTASPTNASQGWMQLVK